MWPDHRLDDDAWFTLLTISPSQTLDHALTLYGVREGYILTYVCVCIYILVRQVYPFGHKNAPLSTQKREWRVELNF